ncbi:chorismate synthase [Anaerosphaera aminiphila DSM 21120]|uniref:Chorismate synthase n=1 Tax=Anaerosphaera aminiphila DSM 21120 TaxID=1120995 RepID=A0A1M5PTW7_9FIRM|nr:chorismate synthase [Anaerosphaera aminiphila]SHH04723.1 chorismate synthase [Anaerosphaera aminiphila DSM 21120]
MSSIVGNKLKLSIFGESHGNGIGAVIDGLPAGEEINYLELNEFLKRRSPGKKFTTKRVEKDEFEILSGVKKDYTTGSPLAVTFKNSDATSTDYEKIKNIPRPSHADYTANIKYKGYADLNGGGHFSGRLTAPMCFAGGIAKQILERKGIFIGAHLKSVGDIEDIDFKDIELSDEIFKSILNRELPILDLEAEKNAKNYLEEIQKEGNSIGAIVQCGVIGVKAGLGNPIFDGIENNIAKIMFGIPGVKGVSFGSGFESAKMKGSEHNDEFYFKDGIIRTYTNNSGGIQGGITNGMPIVVDVAIKPTASIFLEQNSVNLDTGENTKLKIMGRHDPCIGIRAVPVVESLVAFTLLDFII